MVVYARCAVKADGNVVPPGMEAVVLGPSQPYYSDKMRVEFKAGKMRVFNVTCNEVMPVRAQRFRPSGPCAPQAPRLPSLPTKCCNVGTGRKRSAMCGCAPCLIAVRSCSCVASPCFFS